MTRAIFISYRREDAAADATALYQALEGEFGRTQLFKDVLDVDLGDHWEKRIAATLADASVVLLVVNRRWKLSPAVEFELRQALRYELVVVPVLVDDAGISLLSESLPSDLQRITKLNAARVGYESWVRDLEPLFDMIRSLAPVRENRALPEHWKIESGSRSAGVGQMGAEVQLRNDAGDALHLRLRYDREQLGRIEVNGKRVRWEIPKGRSRRRPPRHAFRFVTIVDGRQLTFTLYAEWSSRSQLSRHKAPSTIEVWLGGTCLTT